MPVASEEPVRLRLRWGQQSECPFDPTSDDSFRLKCLVRSAAERSLCGERTGAKDLTALPAAWAGSGHLPPLETRAALLE